MVMTKRQTTEDKYVTTVDSFRRGIVVWNDITRSRRTGDLFARELCRNTRIKDEQQNTFDSTIPQKNHVDKLRTRTMAVAEHYGQSTYDTSINVNAHAQNHKHIYEIDRNRESVDIVAIRTRR